MKMNYFEIYTLELILNNTSEINALKLSILL